MIDNFPAFAKMVADNFQKIAKGDNSSNNVFVTDVDADKLYETYLASFPEGTNPKFKERTEHDCTCCKQFIRRIGNVVTVKDGAVKTVWDHAVEKAPHPYNIVATALRDAVADANICDLFRVVTKEASFGNKETHSFDKTTNKALTWDHFYTGEIPANLRVALPDQVRGDYRTTVHVFERGLIELKPDAVETVLSLIEANNLYRGKEHKRAVVEFQKAQKAYLAVKDAFDETKNTMGHVTFVWTNAHGPASRFRNTVIGTLVQDLSEGADVEHAVKAFENKVAPTNYKRTTAVITPGMVKKAMETIESLGLEPALERRFARIEDISVNDVKWVDSAVKPIMKGGLGDVLMKHAVDTSKIEVDESRAEEISLDNFVKTVLPETTGMELLLKGNHLGNLMSLTAPVHPEPKQLFRWGNDFAWSYAGNVADSIAERVKKAGGKVEGANLRISLSWFNLDDLDLHVYEPRGRGVGSLYDHIHFRNKRGWTGGELDVDMNVGNPVRDAVENVVWMKTIPNGVYKVAVSNFTQRETSNVGFIVEVENAGKISHYSYNKTIRQGEDINVVEIHVSGGVIERIETVNPGITASNVSQEKWGLKTEQYIKVNAVTLSPNYWGSAQHAKHGAGHTQQGDGDGVTTGETADHGVGNKHTFFVLDGCNNDEPTRGIYNEFLHPRLETHRKVFEVIGEKTKCQPTPGQLSGLGFSSTKKDSFVVKVKQGKKQRLFNVKVGA